MKTFSSVRVHTSPVSGSVSLSEGILLDLQGDINIAWHRSIDPVLKDVKFSLMHSFDAEIC